MPPICPASTLLHRLHRWGGLLAAVVMLFYGVTGLLLNHRQLFDYFQHTETTRMTVPVADLGPVNAFVDQYRRAINRPEAPEVIRIKDGRHIELLYGAHGQTTYRIDPKAGLMRVETKSPREPLYLLNRLHKAAKTSGAWLWISDILSLAMLVSVASILLAMRYRPLDICLLAVGVGACLLGGVLA